jgi:hypothetical protein
MDDDTLNLLKTVCAAGSAYPAFNCSSNERLDDLARAGLLAVVQVPDEDPKRTVPRRYYRPTEMGRAMTRKLSEKDAA